MRTLTALDNLKITPRMLRSVRAIAEAKGQEALYHKPVPQALESLRQVALIQSTESSNRIEGIYAEHARIVALVQEKATPQNRDESEIAGYRKVLAMIHEHAHDMDFTPNLLLQLHRDLYQFTGVPGGIWKATDNEITETLPGGNKRVRFVPTPAWQTEDAMRELHERFRDLREAHVHDPLVMIPAYVLDFLCIHPFRDGNGRMARLVTLLLLYREGYNVGRYISLEKLVEDTKEGYYETLGKASRGWHEGTHDASAWMEYFLGVMLEGAYQRLFERVGDLTVSRGAKSKMVVDAIRGKQGPFTVTQLLEACPTVSVDLIRRILQEMKNAGEVAPMGRGPGAKWRRV